MPQARTFSLPQASSTLGFSAVSAMTLRYSLSTTANRRPSVGICRMMSSLEKMGSRYSHVRCTASHSSTTACTATRVRSHRRASSACGLTKGEPSMVCVLTMWSSSTVFTSSTPRTTCVPVAL